MATIRRPVSFVLASTGHGSLIVNRNDYRMLDETRGFGVGYQLLTTSWFDPDEVDMVLRLLRFRRETAGDGVVALDCGANIGVHTVEWARSMHGWGSVIAIEAQERIYYALAGNLAINNCFNASALHVAVGSTTGTLDIPVPDYSKPSSFGSLELRQSPGNEFIGQAIDYSAEKCHPVDLITIDSLALKRLDLLKLDIEGMELEAIAGADETLRRHKPVLLVESIKSDKEKLTSTLEALGYKIFPAGINLLAVHATDPVAERIQVQKKTP